MHIDPAQRARDPRRRPPNVSVDDDQWREIASKQNRQFIAALVDCLRHLSVMFLHLRTLHRLKIGPSLGHATGPAKPRRASSSSVGDDGRSTPHSSGQLPTQPPERTRSWSATPSTAIPSQRVLATVALSWSSCHGVGGWLRVLDIRWLSSTTATEEIALRFATAESTRVSFTERRLTGATP
jgi:hypothetical protein